MTTKETAAFIFMVGESDNGERGMFPHVSKFTPGYRVSHPT